MFFCRRQDVKKLFSEVLLVAISGIAFAFIANFISPRGLWITRNYFPKSPPASPAAATGIHSVETNKQTNGEVISTIESSAADRLKQSGLQTIDGGLATQLFRDARYKQGQIIFIDARDDQRYQDGHIPGAYQFDNYHPEKYLAAVLYVCQPAEQVVVYCNGGDCEDSEFAATTLKDAGIANQKLFVYVGGITEWIANHLPVEVGAQNSGQLHNFGSTK